MKGRQPTAWLIQKRAEALAILTANGWSTTEAKRVLGPERTPDGRAGRMGEMYSAGKTLAEIGVEFNVTRERVRQILQKHGLSSSGGASARHRSRSIMRAESRIKSLNARAERTYGCDYETAIRLNLGSSFSVVGSRAHKWRQQRNNAISRGIAWNLTFFEWCAVWDESGKWQQAGRGKGRYCMSRHGDAGPYAVGNVRICTNEENIAEGFRVNPMAERMKVNWKLQETLQRQDQILEMSRNGKTNKQIAEELRLKLHYVTHTLCVARMKARRSAHDFAAAAPA